MHQHKLYCQEVLHKGAKILLNADYKLIPSFLLKIEAYELLICNWELSKMCMNSYIQCSKQFAIKRHNRFIGDIKINHVRKNTILINYF